MLSAYTKAIPLTNKSLFGDGLGKVVAQAATASRDYKALGNCFILSGLSRPQPPTSGRKWKVESLPLPFRGTRQPS